MIELPPGYHRIVQLPIHAPNVHVPNAHVPNVHLPNVHVPNVHGPHAHVPYTGYSPKQRTMPKHNSTHWMYFNQLRNQERQIEGGGGVRVVGGVKVMDCARNELCRPGTQLLSVLIEVITIVELFFACSTNPNNRASVTQCFPRLG